MNASRTFDSQRFDIQSTGQKWYCVKVITHYWHTAERTHVTKTKPHSNKCLKNEVMESSGALSVDLSLPSFFLILSSIWTCVHVLHLFMSEVFESRMSILYFVAMILSGNRRFLRHSSSFYSFCTQDHDISPIHCQSRQKRDFVMAGPVLKNNPDRVKGNLRDWHVNRTLYLRMGRGGERLMEPVSSWFPATGNVLGSIISRTCFRDVMF